MTDTHEHQLKRGNVLLCLPFSLLFMYFGAVIIAHSFRLAYFLVHLLQHHTIVALMHTIHRSPLIDIDAGIDIVFRRNRLIPVFDEETLVIFEQMFYPLILYPSVLLSNCQTATQPSHTTWTLWRSPDVPENIYEPVIRNPSKLKVPPHDFDYDKIEEISQAFIIYCLLHHLCYVCMTNSLLHNYQLKRTFLYLLSMRKRRDHKGHPKDFWNPNRPSRRLTW